jgi:hypothetical protein
MSTLPPPNCNTVQPAAAPSNGFAQVLLLPPPEPQSKSKAPHNGMFVKPPAGSANGPGNTQKVDSAGSVMTMLVKSAWPVLVSRTL